MCIRDRYPTNPLVGTRPNPYSLLNNVDRGNTDRVLGNIFVEARPLDGLTLRINAGIDLSLIHILANTLSTMLGCLPKSIDEVEGGFL